VVFIAARSGDRDAYVFAQRLNRAVQLSRPRQLALFPVDRGKRLDAPRHAAPILDLFAKRKRLLVIRPGLEELAAIVGDVAQAVECVGLWSATL
jgi:hypothetical protein